MFPGWIRSSMRVFATPKPLFSEIKRFFTDRSILVEQSQIDLVKKRPRTIIEYCEGSKKRKNQESFENERNNKLISDFFNVYGEALQLRSKCNEGLVFNNVAEESNNSLNNLTETKSLNNVIKIVVKKSINFL